MQVSNDTRPVINTDTAGCHIAGIDYQVLGIAITINNYKVQGVPKKCPPPPRVKLWRIVI